MRFQYASVLRQIPALHLVALLNVLLVAAVLWHQGAPLFSWAWTPAIGIFNIVRIVQWARRGRAEASLADQRRFLRTSAIAALASVALISGYSAWSLAAGLFAWPILIPVSVAFGAFGIAHCIATLRTAAMAVLITGVVPSATMMILSGDFLALCLGVSASSVVLLQLGFIADHRRHVVATLRLQAEIETVAHRDSLTGLLNRRAFLAAWERGSAGHVLLAIDIDHFKRVNDSHGHDVGDHVLTAFADVLTATCRSGDVVARLGGEEFVVLAPVTHAEDAVDLALRLRAAIEAHDFRGSACPVQRLTASIGVHVMAGETTFAAAFAASDAALYAAKANGRNRVQCSRAARVTPRAENAASGR